LAVQFVLPRQVKINVAGRPYAGAKAYFYQTGTEVLQTVYQDQALTTPHDQPVIADDDGYWPVIWLNTEASSDYRVVVYSATGSLLDDISGVARKQFSSSDIATTLDSLQRTPAEISAGVTPVNYAYPPGDVRRYGATGSSDDSYAFYLAGKTGHDVYVPDGDWYAAVEVHRDNYVMRGAGKKRTRILIPLTSIDITALSRTSNVVTVTTARAHNIWVGKAIRIEQCATTSFNYGYIVLSILSQTQFTCQQLNESQSNGTATTAKLTHSSVIDCGALCNGNSATAYSGLVLQGFTVDGQRSLRTDPETDLTDWGVALTKFSNYDIDVDGENCWRGGVALFINSNYGHIRCYVKNCGYATLAPPPGFDVNSSKYFTCDVVSEACKYGTRILDNCFGISGRLVAQDAVVIGHVYGAQSANEQNNNDLTYVVRGGCTAAGVSTGTKCRATRLKCVVQGITGVGVYEVAAASSSDDARSNTYHVVTRECASGSVLIYGNYGTWYVQSELDGRGGSAGDYFAIDCYGDGNTIYATVVDDVTTPKVRGISLRTGADSNRIVSFAHNTLVSIYSDGGAGNEWPFETDGWHAVSYGSGWTNAFGSSYATTKYKKVGNQVFVVGSISGTSGTIFTLPAGYRPTVGDLSVPINDGATARGLTVATTGAVTATGAVTGAGLCFSFLTT